MDRLAEGPEFFPYLTARELLETAGSVRGAGTQRGIERFVGWVGEGALDRTLATLSAGQRRKLALAAASAVDPPVLLLDEPSNTLDLAALDDLRALLEQARERCVVVATHNLERLGLALDRTLIVRDGRVETPALGVTRSAGRRGPGSS
ncbi:bacitracin transport ATP-binding protein [Plesiocystis pacifica SIR-1]|uniref:Bacitracin transport ATP-binding protein n=1 Tax=Plesiocystis pacifica SIR-1 TaxID=391625 RepID=A6G479_9BACT|nr:ATP-binding cassette domain-containing protein [Plesiocystis pacifica]EDM79402.1 bacitracin transport ATP-binding protein [Plesiocystis pacifica SIR-1]